MLRTRKKTMGSNLRITRDWRRRPGLTLMELVIVLAVLAAVSAILIPLFPNLLRRTHKAVDATQSSEVAKSVQLYQSLYISYPDNFDLLTDGTTPGTGGTFGAMPAYLPMDDATVGPFGGMAKAAPLTAAELAALQRAGIQYVQKMAVDSSVPNFHPTMHPYATNVPASDRIDLASPAALTLNFAVLDLAAIQVANPNLLAAERDMDPTARYVVFGVGARCSMVGQTMQDAPMSSPQKKTLTPDTTYCRFGVIFKVSGVEVARTERARFISSVALEDDELESTEKDVVGFHEVSCDPRN